MDFKLKIGLKGEKTVKVSENNTAKALSSGSLEVFSTPAMIALMEGAAIDTVHSNLPDGYGTVGTGVNIKHLAATPLHMTVTSKAELIDLNDKHLIFKVEAYDEKELIGEGIHERYIIDEAAFSSKVEEKKS